MKLITILMISIILSLTFTGCGTIASAPQETPAMATPTPAPTPEPTPSPTPAPEPPPLAPENMGINTLTGEYIYIGVTGRRPVAVVIDTIRRALPQSAIGQADILYEALAEGGTTRLVAIFKDFNAERIGPVRSARSYFVDFAIDHDAIFVHHGGSPASYNDLRGMNIDRLDGMVEGQVFWRDRDRINRGLHDHSSYTSSERIWNRVHERNLRYAMREDHPSMFNFFPVPTSPRESTPASEFEIRFIQGYVTSFAFDEETRLYAMSTTHGAHIDAETGEQLTFSNVIIQNTQVRHIAGDDAGRREITTVGQGTGYLFTNGQVAPIRWAKDNRVTPTRWYNENGLPLNLNIGRTYIAVTENTPTIFETEINGEYEEESQ